MKNKLFLTHDPGGYDVVYPVYRRLKDAGHRAHLFCAGPSGRLRPESAADENAVIEAINSCGQPEESILITGTSWGNDLELRMIEKARGRGFATVSLLDYWSNYALRLRNEEQSFVYPDHYVLMDELAREEAIGEGVPASVIRVLGHPGLDAFIRSKGKKILSGPPGKVLVLSQPLSQLYGDTLGYTEAQVLNECIGVFESLGWQLHIKLHPKDYAEFQIKYERYLVEGALLEMLPDYDLVVGMNSMGLLHAVLLGIPTVSYQPGLSKPDVCITNKLGLTPLLVSVQELRDTVSDRQWFDAFAQRLSSAGQAYLWLDGKSTERVSEFIEGL